MLRTLRIAILSVVALSLASCSDVGEPIAPASPALSSAVASPQQAVRASDDDEIPGTLWPVATYNAAGNPGAQVASAMIGPQGGSLRLGDFEVIVPPGAVTEQTRFSIRTFPEGNSRKHALASFSPHRTFARDLTVRVPFTSTESAGALEARVLWWDSGEWVPMPTSLTADGRLETQTDHFSMYATSYRGFTLAGG